MDLLDRVESEASATVVHCEVCLDGRCLADYQEALGQLQSYGTGTMLEDPDLEDLHAEVERLHGEVKAKTHRYTFRCVPRAVREDLLDDCQPTDSQKDKGWDYDPHRFEPALAARALVEIDGGPVDATVDRLTAHFSKLRDDLPPGRYGWGVLWEAVTAANGEGTQTPKSVHAIVDRLISERNSIMQPDTESG